MIIRYTSIIHHTSPGQTCAHGSGNHVFRNPMAAPVPSDTLRQSSFGWGHLLLEPHTWCRSSQRQLCHSRILWPVSGCKARSVRHLHVPCAEALHRYMFFYCMSQAAVIPRCAVKIFGAARYLKIFDFHWVHCISSIKRWLGQVRGCIENVLLGSQSWKLRIFVVDWFILSISIDISQCVFHVTMQFYHLCPSYSYPVPILFLSFISVVASMPDSAGLLVSWSYQKQHQSRRCLRCEVPVELSRCGGQS